VKSRRDTDPDTHTDIDRIVSAFKSRFMVHPHQLIEADTALPPMAMASSSHTAPCSVFVPQHPSLMTFSTPTRLCHLKVGVLNVAYTTAGSDGKLGATAEATLNPPVPQPLTLPLQLHLHPTLLLPATLTGTSERDPLASPSFIPPTLLRLHSAVLPTILSSLPAMIAHVKVKKVETRRANRVGIMRNHMFCFTYTFKETPTPYHMLSISSKRIRQLKGEADRDTDIEHKQSSSSNVPLSSYRLSTELSTFSLFDDPSTRVELLPVRRTEDGSLPSELSVDGQSSEHDHHDDGVYAGMGYASYLVSRHTLHVRILPRKAMVDRMESEREAEVERRRKEQRIIDKLERTATKVHAKAVEGDDDDNEEEEEEEEDGVAGSNKDDGDDDDFLDDVLDTVVGTKRKALNRTASTTDSNRDNKKRKPDTAASSATTTADPSTAQSATPMGATSTPISISSPDVEAADVHVLDADTNAAGEDDMDDWLQDDFL